MEQLLSYNRCSVTAHIIDVYNKMQFALQIKVAKDLSVKILSPLSDRFQQTGIRSDEEIVL